MNASALETILGRPALPDLIGETPLLPIAGLDKPETVHVFGKAEWFNPGGSVKDRAAWSMVDEGRRTGAFRPGQTLLDATSGNTGIAFAWLGAALGFAVRLAIPANANRERRRLLSMLGADLVFTDPMDGTDGAIREARRIAAAEPERWFYPDQYSNAANWHAHYLGTAEEIWEQTEGRVTHFVAGIGTSGTLVGTSRRLRERNPLIDVTGVVPDSPYHALEGLKHLGTAMVPPIYDPRAHDRLVEVQSDAAIDMVRRQARHGLLIGWSSGAALVAAERMAQRLSSGVLVCVLPDGAERYLSDPLWDDVTRDDASSPDARPIVGAQGVETGTARRSREAP